MVTRIVGAGIVALGVLAHSFAAAESLKLVSGDFINGTVVEETDAAITLDHAVLGRVVIPRDQIEAVLAQAPKIKLAEPPPEVNPGLFGTGFLAGWKRSLGAGVSGSEGNSKVMDVNADLLARFEDDSTRWNFKSAYYLSRSNDETTKNQAFTELLRDFLFPGSRWFLFTGGRYDYDEFEAWDHRVAGNTGIGYDIVKSETFDLRGRLGAGVSYTFGGETQFAPELVVGSDGVWRISDSQRMIGAATYYPDLSDPQEFRTLSTLDWVIGVSEMLPLSLKIGLAHEYQSNTSDDKNDFKYLAGLLYDF